MMILQSVRSKLLPDVSSSLMYHYILVTLVACLHVAGHPLCISL